MNISVNIIQFRFYFGSFQSNQTWNYINLSTLYFKICDNHLKPLAFHRHWFFFKFSNNVELKRHKTVISVIFLWIQKAGILSFQLNRIHTYSSYFHESLSLKTNPVLPISLCLHFRCWEFSNGWPKKSGWNDLKCASI